MSVKITPSFSDVYSVSNREYGKVAAGDSGFQPVQESAHFWVVDSPVRNVPELTGSYHCCIYSGQLICDFVIQTQIPA